MERRVAGEVLFKKGHMALDWRRRASIVVAKSVAKVEEERWWVARCFAE